MKTEDLLIWWLSEANYGGLTTEVRAALPRYIAEEVQSREGRSGRGRLWVPQGIELGPIPWPPDNPNAQKIDEDCSGGIVFRRSDFAAVKDLPGFVTNTSLETFSQ